MTLRVDQILETVLTNKRLLVEQRLRFIVSFVYFFLYERGSSQKLTHPPVDAALVLLYQRVQENAAMPKHALPAALTNVEDAASVSFQHIDVKECHAVNTAVAAGINQIRITST